MSGKPLAALVLLAASFVVGTPLCASMCASLCALPGAPSGAFPQARLGALREQFRADHDAVHRAKNFWKLGDTLLAEMRTEAEAGDVAAAQRTFEEFRGDLRSMLGALKQSGRNAEQHPSGFKELQIYLRKTLRDLDQIILIVPFEQRHPFETTRGDVAAIDDELFHILFPRQPAGGTGDKTPRSRRHERTAGQEANDAHS